MYNAVLLSGASMAALFTMSATSSAQFDIPYRPSPYVDVDYSLQRHWFTKPGISPYLNLTLPGSQYGLPNYQTLVRPRLQSNARGRLRNASRVNTTTVARNPTLSRYYPAYGQTRR